MTSLTRRRLLPLTPESSRGQHGISISGHHTSWECSILCTLAGCLSPVLGLYPLNTIFNIEEVVLPPGRLAENSGFFERRLLCYAAIYHIRQFFLQYACDPTPQMLLQLYPNCYEQKKYLFSTEKFAGSVAH